MYFLKSTLYRLQLLLLVLLFIGTQMPGQWRDGLQNSLHAPFGLSSWAHFCLFLAMAGLARIHPMAWPVRRVVLMGLALALVTEGLQFFAINRHPGLGDVVIDMAGTVAGLLLSSFQRSHV